MKKVMEHYGDSILTIVVLLALGAIILSALSAGGYVDLAFKDALTGFFGDMSAIGSTP
ncbi:MAG: hypothetical protein J6K53_10470 [Roseburia sp.]|nr:hypothetical protein [Roseburia sp.]